MYFIAIETSTAVCSAALLHDAGCVKSFVDFESQQHARHLPLFVEQLLDEARKQDIKIDAVALSQGPGSYTGLRIGTATAKGLCYGLNVPLIAIDTLQLMACSVVSRWSLVVGRSMLELQTSNYKLQTANCKLRPMIDARRMEVYTALYDWELNRLTDVEARVIDESFPVEQPTYLFGDGSAKCKEVIASPNAVFIDDIHPLASDMGELAVKAYKEQRFADVAYFDPFYLKEFQATVARSPL